MIYALLFLFLLPLENCLALRLPASQTEAWADNYDGTMKLLEKNCKNTGLCHSPLMEVALLSASFEIVGQNLHSNVRDYDLYEFGVYTGKGIGQKLDFLNASAGVKPRHVWGFDSFEGLPVTDDNPGSGYLDVRSIDNSFQEWKATEKYVLANINFENTTLIKGFYNESLNAKLVDRLHMRPAWWVNIDCDLYVSTFQALDWMFANKLMRPGTIVYYDDLQFQTKERNSELKAHREITAKYNVMWKEKSQHNNFYNEMITYLYEVISYTS